MRVVTCLAIGALLAPSLTPAAALAQPQGPADACGWAIRYEVQNRYPQARGVRILSAETSGNSRYETRVAGSGEFEDRNGGEARFHYNCTYNYRNGRTYDLDIRDVRPSGGGGKDNSAAIAGLVLGAIVVGALVASSKDRDKDDDWRHDEMWSPADGVRCSSREAVCYKDGRYSRKWTDRIFVR